MTITNRDEAFDMVLALIRDGSRIDRYLKRDDDGHVYCTDDKSDGAVYVAPGLDTTDEEEEFEARDLLERV